MIRFTVEVFLTCFALLIGCYVIPGVFIRGDFFTALLACVTLTFVNITLGFAFRFVNLSLTTMMAGLVTFIVGVFAVLLVSYFMPGFVVGGFFSALWFAVIMGLFKMLFHTDPQRN